MSEVQFQKALQNSIPEEKIIEKKIPLSVGMIVDIVSGKFAKNKGKIVSIDSSNHTVNVQIENLGEVEVFDIDIQRS
jgi:transcription antitermination factor NusG